MKKYNRKKLNLYTQVQRFAARVLLIVWLCISCSLGSVLAVRPDGTTVSANTAALGSFGRLGKIAFAGALLLGGGNPLTLQQDQDTSAQNQCGWIYNNYQDFCNANVKHYRRNLCDALAIIIDNNLVESIQGGCKNVPLPSNIVDQQDFDKVVEYIDAILAGCPPPPDRTLTLYLTHPEATDKTFQIDLIPEDYIYIGEPTTLHKLQGRHRCTSS